MRKQLSGPLATLSACSIAALVSLLATSSPQEIQDPDKPTPDRGANQLMAQPLQQDNTGPFMRAKLAGSQQVLEGIVAENFDLIIRGAEQMKLISETVRWPKSEDPIYQHHSREFQDQCQRLADLARNQNLEGAHYAFLQLETNCFNCHNHVRKNFKVEPPSDPRGPVRLIPGHWDGDQFRPDRTGQETGQTLRR